MYVSVGLWKCILSYLFMASARSGVTTGMGVCVVSGWYGGKHTSPSCNCWHGRLYLSVVRSGNTLHQPGRV